MHGWLIARYCALLLLTWPAARVAGDWPQAGRTPQHTNSSPDSPAPPLRAVWTADFSPEVFYAAEPVVSEQRVFVTTLNGSLYALDLATGARLWHFRAGEVIWGSAACGSAELGGRGLVFVASWDGIVHALDAANGQRRWQFDAEEPISASPCLADDTLFIGTRKGTMLALGTDGKLKWKTPLSWQVFNTAAWDQGKVYVVTMDVRVHCLSGRSGKIIWETEQLWGMMPRDYYPVVHNGRVFLSLTPSGWRLDGGVAAFTWAPPRGILQKYTRPADPQQTRAESPGQWLHPPGELPEELQAAEERIREFYAKSPQFQSLHVLDANTGQTPYIPVHIYASGGLEGLIMPPPVCEDGTLVMACYFSALRLGRFDPVNNRWADILFEAGGRNNDNSSYVSVGGHRIYMKHFIGGSRIMDLPTRRVFDLPSRQGAKVQRVSVLPANSGPNDPFSVRRVEYSGVSPPVISGRYLLWCQFEGHLLTAYEGGEP